MSDKPESIGERLFHQLWVWVNICKWCHAVTFGTLILGQATWLILGPGALFQVFTWLLAGLALISVIALERLFLLASDGLTTWRTLADSQE